LAEERRQTRAEKTRAHATEQRKSPHAAFILLKGASLYPPRTIERSDKTKTTQTRDKHETNKKEAEARGGKERGVNNQ